MRRPNGPLPQILFVLLKEEVELLVPVGSLAIERRAQLPHLEPKVQRRLWCRIGQRNVPSLNRKAMEIGEDSPALSASMTNQVLPRCRV